MLTSNPFAKLPSFVSTDVMQTYIIIMILLVVAGTIFDVIHKKSARYFIDTMRNSKNKGVRHVSGRQKVSIAVKTAAEDVLASGEFCNPRRRIAHLLTMYGFVLYLAAAVVLVFCKTTTAAPAILWHVGALMVCAGGYWFWFFIRADVAAEGNTPFRVMRADLFILSLLASVTLALAWSWSVSAGNAVFSTICFSLYILANTVLFAGVPWSKFAHMFFKPAAAFQKRLSEADGSRDNLPPPADKPAQFGLGIKRELPRHY